MLKQFIRKALPRQISSKQSTHRQRHSQRVVNQSEDGDTESNATGRQNSDLSGFFQLDLPQDRQDSTATEQPAAAWLQAAHVLSSKQEAAERIGPVEEDKSNSSNGSGKQRQQRALQRRKKGPVQTPSASLYQISALLSLSTYFEYKVRLLGLIEPGSPGSIQVDWSLENGV